MPTGSEPPLDAELSEWVPADIPGEQRSVEPADRRVVLVAFAVGVLAAIAGSADALGLGATLCVVGAAAGLVVSGRLASVQARLLAAGATVFAVWLSLRASSWLVPLDALACVLLLAVAAAASRGQSVIDFGPMRAMRAFGWLLESWIGAGAFLLSAIGRGDEHTRWGDRARPIILGLALAAPLVLAVVVLLVSADAVFASLFDVGDVGSVIQTLFWFVVGACGVAGLLRVASTDRAELPAARHHPLNALTVGTVLVSLVVVYGTFATTQAVTLTGGARHVLRTEGLSYAEYARTGFFQLLAVAAITWMVLAGLRALTDETTSSTITVILFEIVIVLTLLIVVVAIARIELYNEEFGLTMPRLFSEVFAGWIGAVFVLAGLYHAGVGARRQWLASAATGLAIAALLALNAVNPEVMVVERNIDRAARTGRFDPSYLAQLSDDALPALAAGIDRLPPTQQERLRYEICTSFGGDGTSRPTGWASQNLARSQAVDARREICRTA